MHTKTNFEISETSKIAILRCLDWFKENSKIADDGSIQTTAGVNYFLASETIFRHLKPKILIPERGFRRVVNLAIRTWLKKQENAEDADKFSTFLRSIEVETKNLEKSSNTYIVLMFLNGDNSIKNLGDISILGQEILIKSWDQLAPLNMEELWTRLKDHSRSNVMLAKVNENLIPRVWDFIPIQCNVTSFGPEPSVSLAQDKFDIFRAALNMSFLHGRFLFFREPGHLSKFLPTPIYGIFNSDGSLASIYYTIEKYSYSDYQRRTIEDEKLDKAKFFLRYFRDDLKSTSIKNHILGLTRLYQSSLDAGSCAFAFLGMYQVIESAVTFRNEHIKNEDIFRRVSTLINLNPMFQDGLRVFMSMRNQLVHDGEFVEDSDEPLQMLKLIADMCIMRLISLENKFHSIDEIKEYLEYNPLRNADLARKLNVIRSIKRMRDQSEIAQKE